LEGSVKKEKTKHSFFEQVMLPYSDVLYSYAYYLTGSREDANDLLQETFLKAFRFLDKFEEGTNAKAWLYRIMRNTYINEYRRMKRQPEVLEYDEQLTPYQMLPSTEGHSFNLQRQLEHTLPDEVADAISRLPERFKSVVVLRDIEDLPYEEIAEALEIPIGTVRSRLHRARALLFERLKNFARDHGYAVGKRFALAGEDAYCTS